MAGGPDTVDLVGVNRSPAQRLPEDRATTRPLLHQVPLDPTSRPLVAGRGPHRHAQHPTVPVDHHSLGAGQPGVQADQRGARSHQVGPVPTLPPSTTLMRRAARAPGSGACQMLRP